MKKIVNGVSIDMTADEIKARQDEEAAWATKKAAIKIAEEKIVTDRASAKTKLKEDFQENNIEFIVKDIRKNEKECNFKLEKAIRVGILIIYSHILKSYNF